MDTLTPSKIQMSDTLSPLKLNDGDEQQLYEVDENQQNNGLKRQRLSECVQMSKIRNKTQQPCACDHTHENGLKSVRCISTAAEPQPPNTTNGNKTHLKGAAHITNAHSDTIKSNGFYHIENGRDSILSTATVDECKFLANLCDGQHEGYFDSLVSSDLSDADMKLAEEKEKCTEHIFANDSAAAAVVVVAQQNGCDRVIIKGHRRTRARSSDSIQAEFYQARKQQMRLQSQNGSDVSSFHKFIIS